MAESICQKYPEIIYIKPQYNLLLLLHSKKWENMKTETLSFVLIAKSSRERTLTVSILLLGVLSLWSLRRGLCVVNDVVLCLKL